MILYSYIRMSSPFLDEEVVSWRASKLNREKNYSNNECTPHYYYFLYFQKVIKRWRKFFEWIDSAKGIVLYNILIEHTFLKTIQSIGFDEFTRMQTDVCTEFFEKNCWLYKQ